MQAYVRKFPKFSTILSEKRVFSAKKERRIKGKFVNNSRERETDEMDQQYLKYLPISCEKRPINQ